VNVQLNNVSDTRKSLVVGLEPTEVAAAHAEVVAEFAQQARIPGFRPGKAPAAMVAKRFAKDIDAEFKQKVVTKAYREGLQQQKLDVLNLVNIEPGEVQLDKPATVTITVDIRPEFKLPDYVGLPTQVAPVEPTEAEVEAVIEAMRTERAEFKTVTRPAAKSDYVKLAYEGTVDGKPIAELAPDKQIYGKVPQTWEEVEGEHEGIIPTLGQQIAGLKTGDKKEIKVTFPADFQPVPALAGKTATYAIEIQEVRERALPPIDEAFLKANRADTLDALKTGIRGQLKMRKESQNRAEQRRQVSEALASKVEIPLPESLIEAETQSVLRNFIEENMRRGVPQEQFEKDKKELFDGARRAATQRVKVQLLLAKVAEAEKLSVTEEDIDTFIYRESVRTQQKPDKLVKILTSDREQLRSVQQSIIFDKAVDFLVSKATVSTVQPKA
jgi:trigger factor